ncbi:MAG TPA: D-alanyl-D-alanine carboxypeptidase/D-alanyl-D-alanine-endopeptidase [Casimicrobiaceae bacterium]|nr:D-alanyl-D-alanine carboxypeptidase/D-alanyl-D-alanine-endopeptidase [Casimicrobiaceae bacterium]
MPNSPGWSTPRSRSSMQRDVAIVALTLALASPLATAELPRPVRRAFLDAGVPLDHVAVVVQRVDASRPTVTHQSDVPMNPASVMKLVTTFAALELLGPSYRWRTEAYLRGPLVDGTLKGDLVLKGRGDPKITIEQWKAFMRELRTRGLERIEGDLVLDRSAFRLPTHDAASFDSEPLRPYNVGPDALLVNFKSVRFGFAPNVANDAVEMVVEPMLPQLAVGDVPFLADGPCDDWRKHTAAAFINQARAAAATFPGVYPRACGQRDWHVALLDHTNYVHGMFTAYFAAAGGDFGGIVREGRAPGGQPFAVLESPPLYDVVRDVNKLSNNVMARQLFLTLAAHESKQPATPERAAEVVNRWLTKRKIAIPGFVIENGSGLSRIERLTAGGLVSILVAAHASPVRDEYVTSLAVAATDGTLERRMTHARAAGRALLKTGSLEGVRALAGYVIDANGTRWILVAFVNHPNAARATPALDYLAEWVYRQAAIASKGPR